MFYDQFWLFGSGLSGLGQTKNIGSTTMKERLMTGKTISSFKILEKLGQGGMGIVYKARDTKLERFVAIKFLLHIDSQFTDHQQFKIEAQAAAALNHPNINTIHAIDNYENQTFIVMEYIEGNTLRNVIQNEKLDMRTIIHFATQIAAALNAAHTKGIIHQDIKSDNIMVTATKQIKIMDFGLAIIGKSANAQSHITMGTIAYMSPEQLLNKPVDSRTDIFSFGVVLYEMLFRDLPFKGKIEQEMIYAILNLDPEHLSNHNEDIPEALIKIVNRLLKKDRKDRYQSMAHVIDDLKLVSQKELLSIDPSRGMEKTDDHNLPIQLTSFIGREKEIIVVKRLIQENRLVTLTGTGGCGKTRLAIQISKELIQDFPDGVWFVDLAPLTDGKLVPEQIAQVLHLQKRVDVPVLETVSLYVKDKRILLLIDNCEHVVRASRESIKKLLEPAKKLKILATSRAALNLAEEVTWRVPSLQLPDLQKNYQLNQLSRIESIHLFEDRAHRARPDFTLYEQNATPVATICCRLDGIPLAIELAAARIKLLGSKDILSRLDNRFRFLTGGTSTDVDRQKTLRATIDWSYDLLSVAEKVLLSRLSIFTGGCDMYAVEKVCAFDPLSEGEIIDLLSHLIDNSLLITHTQQDGSVRYQMLETIHQYAEEKVLENQESDLLKERHFRYYLELSEKAYTSWLSDSAKWLRILEIEHENLRAALEWSEGNAVEYSRMVGALCNFWFEHSHAQEAIHFINLALEKHDAEDAVTARTLAGKAAIVAEYFDQPGLTILEESLKIWRKLGDKKEIGKVILEITNSKCIMDDLTDIFEMVEETVGIFEELGDQGLLLYAKTNECFVYICHINPNKAMPLARQNLVIAKQLNLPRFIYLNQHYYADATLQAEDFINAELRYGAALKAAWDSANIFQAVYEMRGISNSLCGQGRYEKALILHGIIEEKVEELGAIEARSHFWQLFKEKHLFPTQKMLGDLADELEQKGRKMGFEKAVAYALDDELD